MMEVLTATFFLILATSWSIPASAQLTSWGYEPPYGPANWTMYNSACGGDAQSPINIVPSAAVDDSTLGAFEWSFFGTPPTSLTFKNTEHSLQADVEGGYTITDSNLLPGNFKLVQFHIHWAKPGEKGSEHTLDGRQYFGELHFVHYNTKYADVGLAVPESDGLAVLGVFLEDDSTADNAAFGRFLAPLAPNGSYYGDDNVPLTPVFAMNTLLPLDLGVYYRYQGSLTTPNCSQSVTWTVFEDVLHISRAQAASLETMVFESASGVDPAVPLYGNFRPPQALNGRSVRKSVVPSPTQAEMTTSQAPSKRPSTHLLAAVVLLFVGYFSLH